MVLRLLPWALCLALVLFTAATYSTLPAAIPQHLNAAGEVTRTLPTSWFTWMLLPLIAVVIQGLMTGATLLLPKRPDLFNFPEKERFLKLPPEYRGDVIPRMQQTMDALGALTVLVLFGVQVMLWRVALGHSPSNVFPILILCTVVFLPAALVLTARVNTATEEAHKKWVAATAGKDSRSANPR